MLVQFKFRNYKCFKDETVFNLVASNYFKDGSDNISSTPFYSVIKTAVLYGSNASGKTKLFLAFDFMRNVVLDSANNVSTWRAKYDTFRLNTASAKSDSSFEAVFVMDGIQYRYGFEVNGKQIMSEWLFRKKVKEVNILYREGNEIEYNSRYVRSDTAGSLIKADMVRPDALFLSALSIWNDPLSKSIVKWFFDSNVLSASIGNYMGYSLRHLNSPMKSRMLAMMNEADIAIEDMAANEVEAGSIPDEVKRLLPKEALSGKIYNGVKTLHKLYNENYMPVGKEGFSLEEDESYGTSKFFALTAPLIDTLDNGKRLWVDEIDNGLHPDLLLAIIRLFQSPETNPHNAQLIINTHNRSLLDERIFRRDQIYLVSKNRYGEASVRPITDYRGINLRKNTHIGDLYRAGKLGGVPYLGDFGEVFSKK